MHLTKIIDTQLQTLINQIDVNKATRWDSIQVKDIKFVSTNLLGTLKDISNYTTETGYIPTNFKIATVCTPNL